MSSMQAVRIQRFGGPDVMSVEATDVPRPEKGEVLVRVAAAGLNPVDYKIREGLYPEVKEDRLPLTLGREVAGTVEQLGEGVTEVKAGDRVFGMIGADGGFAEFARLKVEHLARIPDGLDWITAASLPLAGHTAWQALFDHGRLTAGQQVLIHGGGGGVGHFAIQFAKAKGATVYATGSQRSLDFIRSMGADRAIDYKAERFEEVCQNIDLVIDLISGETQDRSWAVLREGGRLVSTLQAPKQDRPEAEGKTGMRFTAQPNGDQLEEMAGLISAGKVRPVIHKTFPLDQVAEAMRMLAEDHVSGKIVLTIEA